MKIQKLTLLVLFIALFTVTAAWCDVVDDIIDNDRKLAGFSATRSTAAGVCETALLLRESDLFAVLLQSKENVLRFVKVAETTESDVLKRFYDRVRFEVSHEKRSDLSFLIENPLSVTVPKSSRSHKKIVFIYGSEVNMLDGEWHNAPDGRRFWVSNESPDIVLSPAEYRRHFKNATTVED